MPKRHQLLELLRAYAPSDEQQKKSKNEIEFFVSKNSDCFLRSNLKGHVTGSCWLISPDASSVLLTHHRKIGKWLQLGGHADGDSDILRVALREAEEESGISSIKALSDQIFDVDVHAILPHQGVLSHYHYDIRFVLRAPHQGFAVSDESHALAWVAIEELAQNETENPSLARMARKWLKQKNAFF